MKKIIIVDDDIAIRDSASLIFDKQVYAISIHEDASALLDKDFELPDIFIIDKQLPGVDGLDLCKHLKKRFDTAHIPVVIISASPAINKLAELAGADAFIEKPYSIREMRGTVEKYVG